MVDLEREHQPARREENSCNYERDTRNEENGCARTRTGAECSKRAEVTTPGGIEEIFCGRETKFKDRPGKAEHGEKGTRGRETVDRLLNRLVSAAGLAGSFRTKHFKSP